MHNSTAQNVLILVIVTSFLILLLILFIALTIYRYQEKQNDYFKNLEEIKIAHNNAILQSQIEMQEQTFQNISREIHDNIGQKLTLAKLQLNTLPYHSVEQAASQVNDVVSIIGNAINDLSDISRSMSSEMVLQNGFIKGLEYELAQIKKSGDYHIIFNVSGNTVFLEANTELVLFRLTQEVLHNILKHARANTIEVNLHFEPEQLKLRINDNGRGFDVHANHGPGTGIQNMQKRVQILSGSCVVDSDGINGTHVTILIPSI
jgi:signal transduction histidine kinase